MRFMLIVYPRHFGTGSQNSPQDVAQTLAKVREFNKTLLKANVLVTLYGLFPPGTDARLTYSGGFASRVEGAGATHETVGGCWILQVATPEEAFRWAGLAPMNDGDMLEVRQVHEATDWPEDILRAVNVLEDLR